MRETLSPSCEALIAATYPPGPPPTIQTSYFSVGCGQARSGQVGGEEGFLTLHRSCGHEGSQQRGPCPRQGSATGARDHRRAEHRLCLLCHTLGHTSTAVVREPGVEDGWFYSFLSLHCFHFSFNSCPVPESIHWTCSRILETWLTAVATFPLCRPASQCVLLLLG